MSEPAFKCPCCGQETAVAVGIDDLRERFAGMERDMIDALASGRWISREALFTRSYGHRADGGPETSRVILVRICFLRRKLRPFGYVIECRKGGWANGGGLYRLAPVAEGVTS